MAKSGGVLNAICAKLLKGNLSQVEGSRNEECSTRVLSKVAFKDTPKEVDENDQPENFMNNKPSNTQVNDHDIDKENNNTAQKTGSDLEVSNLENKEDSEAPAPTPPSQPPLPSQGSEGRKNRRKSGKPRNIIEFRDINEDDYGKDELDQFEINNRDVDFDEIYRDSERNEEEMEDLEEEDDGALDLSGGMNRNDREPSPDSESMDNKYEDSDGDRALDLSVFHNPHSGDNHSYQFNEDSHSNDDTLHSSYQTDDYANNDSNMDSPSESELPVNLNAKQDAKSLKSNASAATPVEAVAMKNYAKNTVNELLSMYGLSDEAEAITKNIQNIPLQKFSAGHILQHQPGAALPQSRGVKRPIADASPKIQNSNSANASVPTSGSELARNETSDSQKPSVKSALASFAQNIPNEGMYAKFVDSFSKLAKLPQGDFMGSPPAMVPGQNNPIAAIAMTSRSQLPPMSSSPGKTSAVNKFATSAEYVKACFNPSLAPKLAAAAAAASGGKALLPDYSKYIKRFSSYELCGGNHCRDMSYKEHFHCLDCSFRVFVKKEEMIRHFKWHKKRDESLQHGFMRYSPMDDCSKKFGPCTHNGRQTHYHCLQPGCNKVYISTSDTQMHANYHRKDSAIIQEGFQRFRATEDCGTQSCSFYGQRTTHFHCRRTGCHFTFKNKADMEKHKAYHQKDEILGRDGFKKFMKYENCPFQNCRYSKSSNHIHCIRPGCEYVLHSTGQLYSHKRRHERRDFENAYRRFKDEQKKVPDGNRPILPADRNSKPIPQMMPTSMGPAKPIMSPPQPNISPAHPNNLAAQSSIALGHSKVPPKSSSAAPPQETMQSASNHAHRNNSPTSLPMKPTQESEYIDLEDLSQYSRSRVSSPDISMTPTDLSLSSSSSTSPSDIKTESQPLVMTPKAEVPPSVGLDLSNNKPQASTLAKLASKLNSNISLNGSLNLPIPANEPVEDKPKVSEVKPIPPPPSYVPSNQGVWVSPGVKGFVPKTAPPVNEKREKDESWKRYLTRYTANDPCHPRCQFLYKDHYHCNIEGCE